MKNETLILRQKLSKLTSRFFQLLLRPVLWTRQPALIRGLLRLLEGFGFRVYSTPLHDALACAGHPELARDMLFAHIRTLTAVPLTEAGRKPSWQESFDPIPRQEKQQALAKIVQDLEHSGVRPFLCFGLLLGYVREGDFMAHDMDLDLGIFWQEHGCNGIHATLQACGYEIRQYEADPWPCRLKVALPGSPIEVDIVFFHRAHNHLQTYFDCFGQRLIRNRTPFTLKRADFHGLNVWIPDPPEAFLNENYNNWHRKSDYHHPALTSPLTDFTLPVVEYCLARSLARSLQVDDAVAARALARIGVQQYPDSTFWQQLNLTYRL